MLDQASADARPIAPTEHKPGPTPARLTEPAPGRRYGRAALRSRAQGDRRGAPSSRDSTTKHTGLQGLRRSCAFAVVALRKWGDGELQALAAGRVLAGVEGDAAVRISAAPRLKPPPVTVRADQRDECKPRSCAAATFASPFARICAQHLGRRAPARGGLQFRVEVRSERLEGCPGRCTSLPAARPSRSWR
jgi:hypothetical protein